MGKRKPAKQETKQEQPNIFKLIIQRCEELDRLGNAYLDTLPFLTNDEMCQRIWVKAHEIYKAANEDSDAVPDWVLTTVDGCVPYSQPPRNGSLRYLLGYSLASNDAHLRNLLEIAEGRTTKELDFPVVAEMPVLAETA